MRNAQTSPGTTPKLSRAVGAEAASDGVGGGLETCASITPPAVEPRTGSVVLAVHVVDQDAGAFRRHRQPFATLERALRVLVAALPMLAHRRAGELVILGVTFVGLLLVDQVQDRDLRQVGE